MARLNETNERPITMIALDTNILLYAEKFKADIFSQIKEQFGHVQFVVPEQVVTELQGFLEKKSLKKSAQIALQLLEKNQARKVKVMAKNADEALIILSREAIIASNDKKLLEKVRKNSGKTLILRQKKFIEMG